MDFEYNENACVVVKEFYSNKISECKNETDIVRKQKEIESDPFIVRALSGYIIRKEKDINEYIKKIRDVDDVLNQK